MEISHYMAMARDLLEAAFPGRLVCLGLQGSYARGEATDRSDIDLVVILDRVELADVLIYRDILDRLPEREKSCGFFPADTTPPPRPVVFCSLTPSTSPWREQATGSCAFSCIVCSLYSLWHHM